MKAHHESDHSYADPFAERMWDRCVEEKRAEDCMLIAELRDRLLKVRATAKKAKESGIIGAWEVATEILAIVGEVDAGNGLRTRTR